MKQIFLLTIVSIILFNCMLSAQIPKTISYQGILTDDNSQPLSGDQSLTFKLYDAASEGNMLWEEIQTVSLADGLFNVILGSKDPLDLPFNQPYWLSITVGSGNELEPRTQLTASPYSMTALSVPDSSITTDKLANGSAIKNITIGNDTLKDNVIIEAGNKISLAVDNNRMTISANSGGEADADWNISGNNMSSVVSGNVGVGTDNPSEKLDVNGNAKVSGKLHAQSLQIDGSGKVNRITNEDTLEIYVADNRVIRAEPSGSKIPNIILGSIENKVTQVIGASILGGLNNICNGSFSTISGGRNNLITGTNGTVSGGSNNTASGSNAIVAGGVGNVAAGGESFAAGTSAKANHDGSFVWSDGFAGGFESTAPRQFLIKAFNGVGIGTNAPAAQLDIKGDTRITNQGNGAVLLNLNTQRNWVFRQLGNDNTTALELKSIGGGGNKNFIISTTGNVGIGTISPGFNLEVNGSAGKPGGGSWSNASDIRLKDVHGRFTRGLDAVTQLNPIFYNYKKDNPLHLPSEQQYVGLIAQEVQKVIPEAVETDKGEYLHLNNDPIIWTMLNAIKQLQKENDKLKAKMKQLESALLEHKESKNLGMTTEESSQNKLR